MKLRKKKQQKKQKHTKKVKKLSFQFSIKYNILCYMRKKWIRIKINSF